MTDKRLPDSPLKGMVPTMNHTGWMIENPDRVSLAFGDYAGGLDSEVLDIGCAYGVATLHALQQGARVLACDIEQKHLDYWSNSSQPTRAIGFASKPRPYPLWILNRRVSARCWHRESSTSYPRPMLS